MFAFTMLRVKHCNAMWADFCRHLFFRLRDRIFGTAHRLKLDLSRGYLKFFSIPAHRLFLNLPSCSNWLVENTKSSITNLLECWNNDQIVGRENFQNHLNIHQYQCKTVRCLIKYSLEDKYTCRILVHYCSYLLILKKEKIIYSRKRLNRNGPDSSQFEMQQIRAMFS